MTTSDVLSNEEYISILRTYGPPFTAGDGHDADPIWLDDVACEGMELSLADCMHPSWGQHNCNHGEDVGIDCRGGLIIYINF